MIVRRTLEGAEKCSLRDFLLEEERAISDDQSLDFSFAFPSFHQHTGVDLGHFGGVGRFVVDQMSSQLVKFWRGANL